MCIRDRCARVHSPEAFNKLVEVKNRPSNKKFPVMCSDIEQIKSIAIVDLSLIHISVVVKNMLLAFVRDKYFENFFSQLLIS